MNRQPTVILVRSLLTAFGGAEHAVALHARALKSRGYSVAVVTQPPVAREHPYWRLISDAAIPIHAPAVLQNHPLFRSPAAVLRPMMFLVYWSLRGTSAATAWRSVGAVTDHWLARLDKWRLRRTFDGLLAAEGPTVLHIYGQEGLTPQLVRWAADRTIPVVYTETGQADENYAANHNLTGTIEVINDIPLVVCPGPTVSAHLRRVYGYRGRIDEIPFLIEDPDTTDTPDSGGERTPVVIGAVGRLVDVKRQADVIWATARLREQGLAVNAVIAGDGPLRDVLQEQAKSERVAEAVTFTGRFEALAGVMHRIDVFVQTSMSEGQPLTITEALAFGKPVVSYDCGDIADLVRDGVNGFLIASGDRAALVSQLARLAADSGMRRRMGAASRQHFLASRSTAVVIQRIERAYQSLVAGAPVHSSSYRAVTAG